MSAAAMDAAERLSRREAVRRIALLMGGTLVGSRFILSGETVADKAPAPFTDHDRELLDAVGDTIIPETSIPGAKSVAIGAFMEMMVTDCYRPKEHAVFSAGLGQINDASRAKYGRDFLALTPAERTDLCNALDAEQRVHQDKKTEADPAHYFRMFKELTVLGYFSSEIGCTKAVRYIEVPGRYDGSYPYKKGDPAWY